VKSIRLLSASEQVAHHLRSEIYERRLINEMPGIHQIATGLMVNHKTVKAALGLLEREGLLVSQGSGKPRRIAITGDNVAAAMRIAILLYEPDDRKIHYMVDLLNQLQYAGHNAFFVPKTLVELGMDVKKVERLVDRTEADAWVVASGSRPVLEWFAVQPFPVFGLFGRIMNVNIASTSPKKLPALQKALIRLVALGHRRIIYLAQEERRKPVPGFLEQSFLDGLEAQGIVTGRYHLPDWEDTPEGFRRLLDSLFRHSPPTALMIDSSTLTVAVLQYFAELGIRAPRDVSLICMDPDPVFFWCTPVISHMAYDSAPLIRRVVRWAGNVARGKDDRRKSSFLAKFIEGGTIGPAK